MVVVVVVMVVVVVVAVMFLTTAWCVMLDAGGEAAEVYVVRKVAF